jgi:hypothetical protein
MTKRDLGSTRATANAFKHSADLPRPRNAVALAVAYRFSATRTEDCAAALGLDAESRRLLRWPQRRRAFKGPRPPGLGRATHRLVRFRMIPSAFLVSSAVLPLLAN